MARLFSVAVCFLCVTLFIHHGDSSSTPCTAGVTDCNYFIQDSSCVEGACVCTSDSVVSADGTKCMVSMGFGGACTDSVQCSSGLGAGGTCAASLCSCAEGYHYLKGRCWRSVSLDESCFQDEQCYAAYDFTGLECQNGVCACRKEYYRRADACRRLSSKNESCIFNSDCNCTGGVCNSRVCSCGGPEVITRNKREPVRVSRAAPCSPGYYDKNGICVPEIGSPCKSTVDCGDTSSQPSITCLDGRACGCDNTRIRTESNRACSKATLIFNTTCTNDMACVAFGAKAICATVSTKKVCACREDSSYDPDVQFCRTKRRVGESCDVVADCYTTSVSSAECTNNVCVCKAGTHASADKGDCNVDSFKVGDPCQEDTDCLFDNSKCNASKRACECSEHYFGSSSGDCLVGIGAPCASDLDCNSVNSTCSTHCQCDAESQVAAIDFSACLQVKDVGERCQQYNQCSPSMGDLRECSSAGVCSCQEGAQFLQKRCYAIKRIGEKCKARAECVYPDKNPDMDAYMCQNGICACQYGYSRDGDRCRLI